MKVLITDTSERNTLVESHLPLVRWVVSTYFSSNAQVVGLAFEDLEQEGAVALCQAADTYKAGKTAFSTYAVKVIRNHLLTYCRKIVADTRNTPTVSLEEQNYEETEQQDERAMEQDSLSNFCAEEILHRRKIAYTGSSQRGIEALELKVLLGYGVTDIARLYGTKANLVGAWMSKAVKQIRKDLTCAELETLGVEAKPKAA